MRIINSLIVALLLTTMFFSCQQDDSVVTENTESTVNSNVSKALLSVLNQEQVNQKFRTNSNFNNYQNSNAIKTTGSYDNFVINTEYINSIEGENFHSLTYLVTYPEHPELYVNLIFFSNDFTYYHPVIYKYNLSSEEITRDVIIREDQMIPIKIGSGQNYLDALAGIPIGTYVDTNDPCVITYWREVPHKCKDNIHLPGDGRCIHIGKSGEAYTTYEFVIDVSDCEGGGNDPGGGNPGGGYVGIHNPGNPSNPGEHYQNPWLGDPGGGGWQPHIL